MALHEQAQARRQAGDWDAAIRLAGGAEKAADKALEAAAKARDAAVEALLSDRQGEVEGAGRATSTGATGRSSVLIEEERVRTLSRSTAQITFRDESGLRLSSNSEAVIMRMRADPLERAQEAKVKLIEGDFYALLAGKSRRKTFELEIPNVETQINSTNFWVEKDRGDRSSPTTTTPRLRWQAMVRASRWGATRGRWFGRGSRPARPSVSWRSRN